MTSWDRPWFKAISVQRSRCSDQRPLQQVLLGHDPREIPWRRTEAHKREAADSYTTGDNGKEIREVRELVADFQTEGLETGGEEHLSTIQDIHSNAVSVK